MWLHSLLAAACWECRSITQRDLSLGEKEKAAGGAVLHFLNSGISYCPVKHYHLQTQLLEACSSGLWMVQSKGKGQQAAGRAQQSERRCDPWCCPGRKRGLWAPAGCWGCRAWECCPHTTRCCTHSSWQQLSCIEELFPYVCLISTSSVLPLAEWKRHLAHLCGRVAACCVNWQKGERIAKQSLTSLGRRGHYSTPYVWQPVEHSLPPTSAWA